MSFVHLPPLHLLVFVAQGYAVQECDAHEAAQSIEAGLKKKLKSARLLR